MGYLTIDKIYLSYNLMKHYLSPTMAKREKKKNQSSIKYYLVFLNAYITNEKIP
jgi:hypothetical protein